MRMILTGLFAALLFALPAQAQSRAQIQAQGQAQMIDKLTAQNVGAALNAAGFRYVTEQDARGYPLLNVEPGSAIAAQNLNVYFFGCSDSGECEDITLWSWYSTPDPVSAEPIHIWNDISRQARNWSRAYIDQDGDAVLVMHINATGGIGIEAVQILVNTYLAEAEDFSTFVGAQ